MKEPEPNDNFITTQLANSSNFGQAISFIASNNLIDAK